MGDEAKETIEADVLKQLSGSASAAVASSWDDASRLGVDHQLYVAVLKSLASDEYVLLEQLEFQFYEVTDEGRSLNAAGSPEFQLYSAVAEGDGTPLAELEGTLGKQVVKLGMGPAMQNKWLRKDGANLKRAAADVVDETKEKVTRLSQGGGAPNLLPAAEAKKLQKRNLISLVTRKPYRAVRGPAYQPKRSRKAADLTAEMLASGEWRNTEFKPYNFRTLGTPVGGGYFHPLLKVRAEFRKILMAMGFEEMPTSRWVESSFWNFDTLFQPQSHPARDAHDTFFIKDPAVTLSWPEDYYERVKAMHERGGSGSIGHRTVFKEEEARKNILRTHTTAISSQMLYRLAKQEGGFTPKKYFSIDRVFRNESMDATHLCEFHQVEGLVADYDLSLGDLIGIIRTFFEKIGITQLRFKPAFNPYTEPSMEVFGYHPDLGKWTEIGNSGIFRPEMLQPMGLPPNVRVIAWGLSLERPTMIKYRIKNIRDLFGHKADMARTKNAPIALFQ